MKQDFRTRWLMKATKITGKSLDYIFYSEETYKEAITTIRNSGCIKPNRIVNKLRDYREGRDNERNKKKIKEARNESS